MKKNTVVSLILLLFLPLVQAQDTDMAKLKKELRIFERILQTSFGVESDFPFERDQSTALAPRNLESFYLRGQGILVQMSVTGNLRGGFFGGHALDFAYGPDVAVTEFGGPGILRTTSLEELAAAKARHAEYDKLMDQYRNWTGELDQSLANALEAARLNGSEPQVIERVESIRERQAVLRADLERKLAEVRELEESESEEADKIKAELAALQERTRRQMQDNVARAQELRNEQEKNKGKRMAAFEATLIDTLCNYGASIRSLPEDEHFTIVIKGAGDGAKKAGVRGAGKATDKIYVFAKSDLISCRDGDMTPEDLLESARAYTF